MRARHFRAWPSWRLLWAAAFISITTGAFAQTPASAADAAVLHRQAADWLTRIHQAAQRQSYVGTLVYQRGGMVQSSRIAHYAEHGEEYERLEALDGKPRTMLRHNADIYTFLPERKMCIVDKQRYKDAFPALLSAPSDEVLDVYAAHLDGVDRVAGFAAQVIELDPKDGYRFAYKLWADRRTGLLLRAQTLDPDGRVLEQIAFSQLQVGGAAADKAAVVAGMKNTAGWQVVHSPVSGVDIRAQGWQIEPDVPGFRLIRQLRRPMRARDPAAPPIEVDQAVFSDGLAAVSVFIEAAAHSDRRAGTGSSGATHMLVERSGDFWVTLLGEVPPVTLQRFASAIEYKPAK